VRKLEDRLGVVLLTRTRRGVSPTDAGGRFASKARHILELAEWAENEFRAGAGTISGDVRLGPPGSVCAVLAPPLIVAARRQHPGIRLIVSEFMSDDLADMLRSGRIDLAILFNVRSSEDCTAERILTERLHLVGRTGVPMLAEGRIRASELGRLPLISTKPPHGLRLLIDRWANDVGVRLSFDYEVDAPAVMVRMVREGLCHSILSPAATRARVEVGQLASAKVTDPPTELAVCLCEARRLVPDAARARVKNLTWDIALHLVGDRFWPSASASGEAVNRRAGSPLRAVRPMSPPGGGPA